MKAAVHKVVVIISSNVEWETARPQLDELFPKVARPFSTPYGEALTGMIAHRTGSTAVVFMHGGWGKIDASASAQYAIDHWHPAILINLGTCGGFEGAVARDTVILATHTLVYDIVEQMGDQEAALAHYTTNLNPEGWLRKPFPLPVFEGLLLSGDRDLIAGEVLDLRSRFSAVAGDWESGAIAHVAARNGVRCLILRGVTDLVGPRGGEAYDGTLMAFRARAVRVMSRLLVSLPDWLDRIIW